ncbi:hypothetical protein PGN35_027975 [Nodosilinea sp. PGN35]|uniref:hypothetical protein n=1 Tax=Nodosilinea sp. PGN35 TaxID=3020489 RepID=UPI0023B320BA|nr:hypothetical protein [Nodosilinea sp. TSF1-S3]MDF0365277.1 hypothetical protein [Nodosilinea sp. TSF1-S3]
MRYWLVLALALGLVSLSQTSTPAQSSATPASSSPQGDVDRLFVLRGRNIARAAAEAANGGLENYMAEPAMHGPTANAPVVISEDGSLLFTFKGFRPEDRDINGDPTFSFETEVLVNPDRTFAILYNGPLRPVTP